MQPTLATIGERFTAQFIDGIIAAVIGFTIYYLVKALGWPLELGFVGWFFYLLVCDGLPGGQSIGKKVTRSAVVRHLSGEPCTYWRSSVRNLSLLILGFIDALFIAGKERRRLGDYLAGTKVIRLPDEKSAA